MIRDLAVALNSRKGEWQGQLEAGLEWAFGRHA